ncbi:MAG: DUF1573 domain-containing protein [Phycisphaerales bacterium]
MKHDSASSRIHLALGTACAIAFGASIVGCDGGGAAPAKPSSQAANPATTPPSSPAKSASDAAIALEPTTLDMGDLIPGVPVTKKVKLTNRGTKPLTVTNAIADCSCTTPSWPEEPIAPGATVETDISINAGPKQGVTLTKRVTFQLQVDRGSGPAEELAFLEVVGKVGLFVEVTPEMIRAPADDVAEPGFGEITLRGADNTPFKVTGFDPPVANAASTESALNHTVLIDWAKWRAERKVPRMTILTDHPKTPELQVLVRRVVSSSPAPAAPKPGAPSTPPSTPPATPPAPAAP